MKNSIIAKFAVVGSLLAGAVSFAADNNSNTAPAKTGAPVVTSTTAPVSPEVAKPAPKKISKSKKKAQKHGLHSKKSTNVKS